VKFFSSKIFVLVCCDCDIQCVRTKKTEWWFCDWMWFSHAWIVWQWNHISVFFHRNRELPPSVRQRVVTTKKHFWSENFLTKKSKIAKKFQKNSKVAKILVSEKNV